MELTYSEYTQRIIHELQRILATEAILILQDLNYWFWKILIDSTRSKLSNDTNYA